MNISVFGLGYVGAVSAACLARKGHRVIGVDAAPEKIALINEGMAPIIEPGLTEIISDAVSSGHLCATEDAEAAFFDTELSLVCVGTPSQANGSLDMSAVRRVCEQLGDLLAVKNGFHIIVMRSTMLPGSMRDVVIPLLRERSGKEPGRDFGVCCNPEFLRESTAVVDFFHPPKTVIGASDPRSGQALASLYESFDAPLMQVDVETAEMVKYTDNAWHALKVGFANEIGNLCKALALDSHRVMDIFCQDTKLNISPCYLKPGFAFGGSCLPKDLRALNYKARMLDVELPILGAILPSNALQLDRAVRMVSARGHRRVGVLGFSFKAGTDDLRESPVVELIERLLGKGYELCIYDRNVNLAALRGSNRDYLLNRIPHVSALMADSMDTVLEHAQTVVVGNRAEEFSGVREQLREDQALIDLVRLEARETSTEGYDGICW
ncbi:nucleotide sugar dehydrogenase [Alkalilimnicola sp. S0819]|uniref:nucleotide sugar dehydrogenase n=1 Tax=Alkalilimnicola sp. S0819 TaxID=2613922 RepID=UPI001261A3EF|nr:nucleotide sugar dehydrogenase [Alkalilimnicola sp. S0819]KAB7627892.1 nucleotide sugar dehydrogenase [Alkalilimnicola sp. S0819]MPQ15528.1 nucleotide sugar dehydrogenase [Alkalilimnicola sp. S0819]